jgi:hypothetical protein
MTTFYYLRFETPPTWRARSPYFYAPGTGWPCYTPRQRVVSDELESESESESESYVTTDGQPESLSWNKTPVWGLRPDLDYCQTVVGLLMWGVLSDERSGLSFAIAAGPRQRSHSRVRVPWDSRPYFTVSDSRLPYSSPPTTQRATVEVFDPASTRDSDELRNPSR